MTKHKTILITGGAGFIGSNLAVSFKRKYPDKKVICLDNLKRRGSELNLPRLRQENIEFVHGDIRNPEDLVFGHKIGLIIECSAEPSVLAGFGQNPRYIINTNLSGTINCLELARQNRSDMIFLSTSRVYPFGSINRLKMVEAKTRFEWRNIQKITGFSKYGISEDFGLTGPKTLYGATKLASELLLGEYINAYGLKAVINRCGVIAGPWQFGKCDQGVFTYWLLSHYFKRNLKYIGFSGKGKQVRDLLHVDDLFALIDLQAGSLDNANGEIFNVGGGREVSLSLLEATLICEKLTGNSISIAKENHPRPGDLGVYLTDSRKAMRWFGWKPKKTAHEIMSDIARWAKENRGSLMASTF